MSDLTRIDAIRIIENITDKDDPAWEWAVEDFYDEDNDTMPSIYDVLNVLGVSEAEYKEATGAQNTKWPEVSDELYISQQVRIDSLEAELSTLKAQREWVSVEDRLPEPGTEVLVWNTHDECMYADKWTDVDKWVDGDWVPSGLGWRETDLEDISHWMPLPPAPEEE